MLVAAVLASATVAGPSLAALAPPPLAPTLVRHLQAEGFSAADLTAIADGTAVARGVPRAERDEAGAIGVVRINLSPDAFLARFRDIVRFERGGGVESVGRFSTPAVDGRSRRLRDCRPRTPSTCRIAPSTTAASTSPPCRSSASSLSMGAAPADGRA